MASYEDTVWGFVNKDGRGGLILWATGRLAAAKADGQFE
jgi:hypothetical protein